MAKSPEELKDLAEFGITLDHRKGTCVVCGGSTKGWSSGISIDSTCEACDPESEKFYTTDTVIVTHTGEKGFMATVKLNGVIYDCVNPCGNWSDLIEHQTHKQPGGKFITIGIGYYKMRDIYLQQSGVSIR